MDACVPKKPSKVHVNRKRLGKRSNQAGHLINAGGT